jgi:hypothetical protein
VLLQLRINMVNPCLRALFTCQLKFARLLSSQVSVLTKVTTFHDGPIKEQYEQRYSALADHLRNVTMISKMVAPSLPPLDDGTLTAALFLSTHSSTYRQPAPKVRTIGQT